MYTNAEHELTHLLLTELLAYQFCSTVQWIKTQDVIFKDFAAERIIEIGPADTLINMAKKTLEAGYEAHDVALRLRRELLSYRKHSNEIYYKKEQAEVSVNDCPTPSSPISTSKPMPEATLIVPTAPAAAVPLGAATAGISKTTAAALPDEPVSPVDVMLTLVAFILKRQRHEVALDRPIKQLCGGRSTLQNEIIGDLAKEFGSLPEQPEEMSLNDLDSLLRESHAEVKLGPCTNALIGKLMSSKMPAGLGTTFFRQHLETRWCFGPNLQDKTLLHAVGKQPSSRLQKDGQVSSFVDGLALDVLKDAGIDPQSLSITAADAPQAIVTVNPEAFEAVRKEQQSLDRRLLEVYARRCNHNLSSTDEAVHSLNATVSTLQKQLDLWITEHGDVYGKGIIPKFAHLKARKYDSYWNWVVQDLLSMIYKVLNDDSEYNLDHFTSQISLLEARATPRLLRVMQFIIESLKRVPNNPRVNAARETLIHAHKIWETSISKPPVFRKPPIFTAPFIVVDAKGCVSYSEIPRPLPLVPIREVCLSLEKVKGPVVMVDECSSISDDETAVSRGSGSSSPPILSQVFDVESPPGTNSPHTSPTALLQSRGNSFVFFDSQLICAEEQPHIKTKDHSHWHLNQKLTKSYLQWYDRVGVDGVSFQEETMLVTGAGKDSIGAEIIRIVLAAGAKVVVTTNSYSKDVTDFYQEMYAQWGGRGSQLVVVPFNGGSQQDIINLVSYIYDPTGLGWDLDHILPFAAVGEAGRAIDDIDSKSELAHRVMLTNLVRLLGEIKSQKQLRGIRTHPAQVILPLSPNHGIFGNDGLYAESKIGLEALLNKWWSEDWNEYLALCGTVIGWTRGTGLMASNDILAQGVEEMGMRTFSKAEMALYVAGIMTNRIASRCELEPLLIDLSGGMGSNSDLRALLDRLNESINSKTEIRRAIAKESAVDEEITSNSASRGTVRKLTRRARIQPDYPKLPEYQSEIEPIAIQLQGMVDLERVVVVAGFGEIGSCGNSRTRWEIETTGKFSVEGCLEMAWIMGLVKYHNGLLKGKDYCGWLEVSSGNPISDPEVKAKYEAYILEHTGIRIIEPREHDPSNSFHKQFLHEVAITDHLEPFEASADAAHDFKREHGDKVDISEVKGGQFRVRLKAGATLIIPRAAKFNHAVGAQIPTGWDARVYGIPEDIISQVDPVTLYAIVSTVEAFLSAGITDPYELYQHIHVSEVGNCIGAGIGGLASLHKMYKQRYFDRHVQKDVLAETFINTTAAWVNMLLLGGSGPIKTPVGACATSLESIDSGFELIASGKAKACLVGGFDGLGQDVAAEFANMQATVDVEKEKARGRTPKEMCRPTASSRSGFVESEGCGIQLLTTAKLALEMGLPIHGVIALTHTASDQIGRSVPAPGKGLLTIACEAPSKLPSPMLNMAYRRRNLELRKLQIQEKREAELGWLTEGLGPLHTYGTKFGIAEYVEECRTQIEADTQRFMKEAYNTYGNEFWKGDSRISPLRGALAVWGLTINDLDVASLHGTSTIQNDLNEPSVIQQQLAHLGRKRGNVLPCVCQKSLTGHALGAAGAFALNGCLQILNTGIVPGNCNADNIEGGLAAADYLLFPNRTMKTPGIKAFSVTSFGFGQKGAQVIGVHARYLFATISREEYEGYVSKLRARQQKAYRFFQDAFHANSLVVMKDKSPYKDGKLVDYLMNPEARLG